ncbi:DNA alkylation response protein [Pueribacillus theae]|uniref:DNA alkylation response protein n=1 Tax=Pueribacillus theae TaxID=2171751 RepID=A0A2U1JVG8_9BACI|nr:acyl-CoA dehydrogenase family protein [Pueribacillus theae]PWA09211.1 DNA alkylation response protein [Pueribacillus theae]
MNLEKTTGTPKSETIEMPDTKGMNFFETDPNLQFLLNMYLPKEDLNKALPHLKELGEIAGDELDQLSRDADRYTPELMNYNHKGGRVDEVKYHPSYTRMEEIGFEQFGFAAMSNRPGVFGWPTPFTKVLKYSFWYLFAQSEFGLCCPMNMTDSAARILDQYASPEMKEKYFPLLTSTNKEERWSAAQFMTEKQGGSDVGANTLTAKKVGDHWELWGDKWFCSNVSADLALALARPEGAPEGTKGLAMFLVPKTLENGEHNRYRINRLKDKLGTRDMASGEITFEGAVAYVVGELNTGFKQMMSMVNSSRLSNAVRSAAMMRRSYLEAAVTAKGRQAFGKTLIDLPLMRENIFEQMLDAEAAASMIFYTSAVYDKADSGSEEYQTLLRVMTPLLKGYICKRARYITAESMEIRGGNGYIEDWVNPKLVRDAHLGSIWEGTTNIIALDIIRAFNKDNADVAFLNDLDRRLSDLKNSKVQEAAGILRSTIDTFRKQVDIIKREKTAEQEIAARRFMDKMFHICAASVLLTEADYQLSKENSYRKLFLFIHYYQRYLLKPEDTFTFDKSLNEWLDEVMDWEIIPFNAIEEILEEIK